MAGSSLTREQRRQLADALVSAAGDLICPPEVPTELPAGISPQDAARQLAVWLTHIPATGLGTIWEAAAEADREQAGRS